MSKDIADLVGIIRTPDGGGMAALGTAQWMGLEETRQRLEMQPTTPSNRIWIGEAVNAGSMPLGYTDDRHVCLVSGTRGGKGTGVIVPNLCLWPGSVIVIDPKGENATVTAQRRGAGSAHARGMGQEVRILDPFGEVQLDPALRAQFNPLDVIDPAGDFAVDDAGRIAAAVIVRENKTDPFFEEAARNLLRGLILHVLTDKNFEGRRNLLSVRRLVMQGDWHRLALLRQAGDTKIPSGFTLLWNAMARSEAYNGVVAGVGEQMISMAEKTRSSVLETLRTNTGFIDGAPMQRLLEKSSFDLGGLKTNPKGLSLYLTLPQRYMDTHFRWLRLMVSLAVGEMERIKGRPKSGYPTLFLLDEFAGLKRMEVIENAVAQAAGFGAKFFFVLQNLVQIKQEYGENWETFVSNSGLKLFFQIDDQFTREYVTKLLGEREVRRETRSGTQSTSDSTSNTVGESATRTTGTSDSTATGTNKGRSHKGKFLFWWIDQGWQEGDNKTKTVGTSRSDATGTSTSRADSTSTSTSSGWNEGVHKRALLNPDELGRFFSRIDDPGHAAYPGLLLAVMPGLQPLVAKRVNYFQSRHFAGLFSPHPDHPMPRTLAEEDAASSRWDLKVRKLSQDPWDPPAAKAAPKPRRFPSWARHLVRVPLLPFILLWRALGGVGRVFFRRTSGKTFRRRGQLARAGIGLFQFTVAVVAVAAVLWIGIAGSLAYHSGHIPGLARNWQTEYAWRVAQLHDWIPGQTDFDRGVNDRRLWRDWYAAAGKSEADGALFWVNGRRGANPTPCDRIVASTDFVSGCTFAQDLFEQVDARFAASPEYRRGWNFR